MPWVESELESTCRPPETDQPFGTMQVSISIIFEFLRFHILDLAI
jgi:hypothetical protein